MRNARDMFSVDARRQDSRRRAGVAFDRQSALGPPLHHPVIEFSRGAPGHFRRRLCHWDSNRWPVLRSGSQRFRAPRVDTRP